MEEIMSEDHLIRYCAPTLAGIKTGSMFTCPLSCEATLRQTIRDLNRRLVPRGVRLVPLRFSEKKALLYIYRPLGLKKDLSCAAAQNLLKNRGYCAGSCENCILQLIRRLRQQEDFPHEIGLFLGYPPEDVAGFLENRANGCKCVGYWKVYGDVHAARKRFAQYKKCHQVYQKCWETGSALERLTVSSPIS